MEEGAVDCKSLRPGEMAAKQCLGCTYDERQMAHDLDRYTGSAHDQFDQYFSMDGLGKRHKALLLIEKLQTVDRCQG